jgi:hypothetical protein
MYPLLTIFFSIVIFHASKTSEKFWIAGIVLFLIVSVLSYWRNYYPYTNEFIIDKKNAYQYVGSQNLDFRQGRNFLTKFLQNHKEVRLAKETPEIGLVAVAIRDYMDIWNLHNYKWLQCYKPVDHIAHSYLIIDTRKPCLSH